MNTDAVVRVAKRASNVVQEGEVGKCTGVNHRPPEETWEGRSSVRDTGGDEKRRYLRLGQRRGLQDPGLGGGVALEYIPFSKSVHSCKKNKPLYSAKFKV